MTENTLAVIDWAALRFDERADAIGARWHGFRRRTVADLWDIGRGLRAHKDEMQHGEWLPYLAAIDMPARTAQEAMQLAGKYAEVAHLPATARLALKAVAEPKSAPAPRPKPCQRPSPADPPAAEPEVVTNPEGEATEAAREAEPDPAAAREERLERLAIRTEDIDGDVVEAWADKLDKANARHREDVATINAERRKTAAAERQLRDMTDALLSEPGCPCCDGVLATFRGVARKGAA